MIHHAVFSSCSSCVLTTNGRCIRGEHRVRESERERKRMRERKQYRVGERVRRDRGKVL